MGDQFDVKDIPAARTQAQQGSTGGAQGQQTQESAARSEQQDWPPADLWKPLGVFLKGCIYISAKFLIAITCLMAIVASVFSLWSLLLHVLQLLKQSIGM